MANKRQIADERDYAAMGVNELLRGLDLFVEPLGEIERLEIEGQKKPLALRIMVICRVL